MPFDNDTNRKRMDRIVEALELLEVSGKANNADGEAYAEMLAPVLDKIGQLTGGAIPAPAAAPGDAPQTSKAQRPRRDIELWKEAQEAPLHELMMAWATINARIMDEHNAPKKVTI
jgi:hypothetical protein